MTAGMHDSTATTFRSKVNFMKSWKPENAPSNRDRLELYALHKQAISGDAPNSFPSDSTVAEKARYQAWKNKRGLSTDAAMSAYITECDRQIRVYGTASAPQTPMTTPNDNRNVSDEETAPRGIAAIPLLCAAAAESRVAYLRRLSRTQLINAWWSRQEPLCGTPGTITSLPEALLLAIATFVEYLSLAGVHHVPLPHTVLQSFLWPLHNTCLAAWMLLILVFTALGGAISLATTILWGSRRTGLSLPKIWNDEILPASQAVNALCQQHQPLSVRLMGLLLLPYTAIVDGLCQGLVEPMAGPLVNSLVYAVLLLGVTPWYWALVVPVLGGSLMVAAFWSGFCFALIDFAGV